MFQDVTIIKIITMACWRINYYGCRSLLLRLGTGERVRCQPPVQISSLEAGRVLGHRRHQVELHQVRLNDQESKSELTSSNEFVVCDVICLAAVVATRKIGRIFLFCSLFTVAKPAYGGVTAGFALEIRALPADYWVHFYNSMFYHPMGGWIFVRMLLGGCCLEVSTVPTTN